MQAVRDMVQSKRHRLTIGMDDLRNHNLDLARRYRRRRPLPFSSPPARRRSASFDSWLTAAFPWICCRIIRSPGEFMQPASDAVTEVARNLDPKFLKEGERVLVGFTGPFGFHRVTPRDLMSSFIGTMVCVEGIVTKCNRPTFS
jgi:DNA replication licensing factor MCM3